MKETLQQAAVPSLGKASLILNTDLFAIEPVVPKHKSTTVKHIIVRRPTVTIFMHLHCSHWGTKVKLAAPNWSYFNLQRQVRQVPWLLFCTENVC